MVVIAFDTISGMTETTLSGFSDQLADAADAAGRSVVQVTGRRNPASGVVFDTDLVVTGLVALGREDALHVRTPDGRVLDAELVGWDPATAVVLLKAPGLQLSPAKPASTPARVGHLALALGRSRSNVLTATVGLVSVIGGPLPTGHGYSIERVIRTSAPMHGGFTGGALVDVRGELVGVCTAFRIRGLSVVVPAELVWPAARRLAEHGTPKRGYLGVAAQPVELPSATADDDRHALLIVNVAADSPAARAGILVGDIIIAMDDRRVSTPIELLRLLDTASIGTTMTARIVRGGSRQDVAIEIGERAAG